MRSAGVLLPIVGPRRHGVVEFGVDLVEGLQRNDSRVTTGLVAAAADLHPPTPCDAVGGVHLQFTDRLFGPSPAAAAEAVRAIVVGWAARGVRVTATLHDVPQAGDGSHFAGRVAAYAAVCGALYGVVVNSHHERRLLSEIGIQPRRVEVVHLPILAGPGVPAVPTAPPSVGVFGFLYPGKGHLEVLTALRDVDPSVAMVAIGEPSAGHEYLVEDLRDVAHEQGRCFSVTGHVCAARLDEALRRVTVPIAHHRHVSASGSLNSWIAAGRRPLAPANRYTVEMSARNPDAFLLYEDDDTAMRDAIRRALADPELTWLPAETTVTPTAADAAGQYERLLRRWHR